MNAHFYNTNQSTSQEVILFTEDAKGQENACLQILQQLKRAAFFEIKNYLPNMHQDSLKRSLSNLQSRGLIVKDIVKENMVTNPMTGKRCHKYQIIE